MRTYQDHEGDETSTSASHRKLERLQLPADLTGKSFLDIGSNEGFFLNAAVERGATRAVGIDRDERRLEFCRQRYPSPSIELYCQTWDTLPEGPFDLILLASAMHYEPDPAALLERVSARLAPGGLFVLECGIVSHNNAPEREMVLVSRRARDLWFPTETFLLDVLLRPFASRLAALPERTGGDPVPRSVYHCSPRLPIVLLLRGKGARYGKSSTARAFRGDATKVIHVDWFIVRLCRSASPRTPLLEFLASKRDAPNVKVICKEIDSRSLAEEYAGLLAEAITPSDETVIIEGYMTDLQAEALAGALAGKALLWDAQRRFDRVQPAEFEESTGSSGRGRDNGSHPPQGPKGGRREALLRRARRLAKRPARNPEDPAAKDRGLRSTAGLVHDQRSEPQDPEVRRRQAVLQLAKELARNRGHEWKELTKEERRPYKLAATRELPP